MPIYQKVRSPFYQAKLKAGSVGREAKNQLSKAAKWFTNRVTAFQDKRKHAEFFKQIPNERKKGRVEIGKMYYYAYDAKYKDVLPFWDRFPLIFPFRADSTHFWGINLHLAPPAMRAVIMDELYKIANNDRFDDTTKINMSWNVLNSLSKSKYIKPCVRQYLKTHVQTYFVEVPAADWEIALFLPLQSIQGGNQKAYAAYRKAIQ